MSAPHEEGRNEESEWSLLWMNDIEEPPALRGHGSSDVFVPVLRRSLFATAPTAGSNAVQHPCDISPMSEAPPSSPAAPIDTTPIQLIL